MARYNAAKTIGKQLGERQLWMIQRIIEQLGKRRAFTLLKEALNSENVATQDGSRLRTKGGVFFQLARAEMEQRPRRELFRAPPETAVEEAVAQYNTKPPRYAEVKAQYILRGIPNWGRDGITIRTDPTQIEFPTGVPAVKTTSTYLVVLPALVLEDVRRQQKVLEGQGTITPWIEVRGYIMYDRERRRTVFVAYEAKLFDAPAHGIAALRGRFTGTFGATLPYDDGVLTALRASTDHLDSRYPPAFLEQWQATPMIFPAFIGRRQWNRIRTLGKGFRNIPLHFLGVIAYNADLKRTIVFMQETLFVSASDAKPRDFSRRHTHTRTTTGRPHYDRRESDTSRSARAVGRQ